MAELFQTVWQRDGQIVAFKSQPPLAPYFTAIRDVQEAQALCSSCARRIALRRALFLLPLYCQQARSAVGKLIDRTGAERTITLTGMALAIAGIVPYALVDPHTSQALLGVGVFVTGLGLGAVTLAAFTATYRGLGPEQIAPATSANRILQQLGGTLGIAELALILQRQTDTHAPSTAFAHTVTWTLALTALAVIPALLLPRAKQ